MSERALILVVDDEPMIRMNMRALLEDLGYRVAEAGNGREALACLGTVVPDLILTDLRMPQMGGLQLVEALRESIPDTPVIVVSGTGTLPEAVAAVRLGAWDYLSKPVEDEDGFDIIIRRTLERARLALENRRYQTRLEEMVGERTRELEESEGRYRRILESVTNYVYTVSCRQGEPVSILHRQGCEALSGFTPEDYAAAPRLWFDMVLEEDRPLVLEKVRRVVAGREPVSYDCRIRHKDGRLRWIHSTLVPNCSADGELLSYDGIVTDVTRERLLEGELRHSQKMEAVGTLAGCVAHDFNNILTVMLSCCGFLHGEIPGDGAAAGYLGQLQGAAERASVLTRSLLAFSRKQPMTLQTHDLNALVAELEGFLLLVLGGKVGLRIAVGEIPLPVRIDRPQIEQVLMNLATNARDAMPAGGELTVRTEPVELDRAFVESHGYGAPGRYAVIFVADTGCGMDEETRKRIFEPYFTTKEEGRGTGLGLSIVYGIVKQHNGCIDVQSEPGGGTEFTIYLPLV